MTASTTPRLGLMLPSSSDNFVINDFDDTFSKLDGVPGITPVANYTALTALGATLTSSQNNSVYLQSDNGSLWQWIKPGSPAGSFRKLNTVGMIKAIGQTAAVSTSSTDSASGPAMINTTFTFPGGRWCIAFFSHRNIFNSGPYGYSVVDLWVNGNFAESSVMSGGAPNKAISHRLFQPINPGGYGGCTPGATTSVKVSIHSSSYGGGTVSAPADGQLYIFEI